MRSYRRQTKQPPQNRVSPMLPVLSRAERRRIEKIIHKRLRTFGLPSQIHEPIRYAMTARVIVSLMISYKLNALHISSSFLCFQ